MQLHAQCFSRIEMGGLSKAASVVAEEPQLQPKPKEAPLVAEEPQLQPKPKAAKGQGKGDKGSANSNNANATRRRKQKDGHRKGRFKNYVCEACGGIGCVWKNCHKAKEGGKGVDRHGCFICGELGHIGPKTDQRTKAAATLEKLADDGGIKAPARVFVQLGHLKSKIQDRESPTKSPVGSPVVEWPSTPSPRSPIPPAFDLYCPGIQGPPKGFEEESGHEGHFPFQPPSPLVRSAQLS